MTSVSRPRVHVTGAVPAAVEAAIAESFSVVGAAAEAEGVLALITSRVDEAYLTAAGPQLRIVANYGVGVDNIDLAAAARHGVVVTNTPDVLTETTAELAIALTLSLLRRVTEGDRFLRAGNVWGFSLEFMLGTGLTGSHVAIVGPGRIGRATARLAEAFGAEIMFVGRGELAGALPHADVVSIHCPLTPETRHLIDARALSLMRPSAVLVNTARGAIVDERALVDALRSGTIAGAALDVFEHEPTVTQELLSFENVVLTPHLGSATRATREAMGLSAVSALRAFLLEGRNPPNVVAGSRISDP
jgi:glyoxylate reductase